jgi:DNA modification methylase
VLQVQEVEISKLKPWEDNPRLNDIAVDAVARSIQSFGFNVPILCDQDFTIVAGHTRWKAAKKIGLTTVPTIVLQLTDSQRRAFAVTDNKTAEIAEWDFPKLREVLQEIRLEEINLGDLGFSDEELRKLLGSASIDEDALPEVVPDGQTKTGDIWVLGRHRLLCGDSREAEAVELLTEGRKVDHVFAGPPFFNQREYSQWDDYRDYLADMRAIIDNVRNKMRAGTVLVWNIGSGSTTGHDHTARHSSLLEQAGLRYLDTIIWVKSGANFSIPRNCHIRRNRCYYPAFQWEALLVFQQPGEMPRMSREGTEYMASHQTNVWNVPPITRQKQTYGHPAVCPVEIPYRCFQAYSAPNATVLEPFGGSGTSLIAAEQSGRSALLMERMPDYCDLIVRRWEVLTGLKARRIAADQAASPQQNHAISQER